MKLVTFYRPSALRYSLISNKKSNFIDFVLMKVFGSAKQSTFLDLELKTLGLVEI